ncbi:LysR family transcriptional regulator [Phenylobacterium koreense]|uniref:LysR family transcriptional regulator for bpeEF and oprC n=1 Tax=Phenylobacterium koreense TaxID=266125 RepID=A0ABV2ENE8_9CAUL
MDRIAALQFFVRVVESGSFSQAARELGVGQPTVSKQVAALERRLGAQLLNRTSRRLRLTPAGADFYEAAVRILGELDDAESRVANAHEQPSGAVRVATPPILTGMMIVPELPEFFLRFPGIAVEFVVSERYADLVQEGVDLAIRIGNLDSSGLLSRRIGSLQIATVASPEYLARHGAPLTPSDLDAHHLLANRYLGAVGAWRFQHSEREVVTPTSGRFSCNDPADVHAAVLAGLGIAQSARALFEAELRSGAVVELLAGFVPEPVPIHVIYGSNRIPQRARIVSDFIAQCLHKQPSVRLRQPIP